MRVPDDADLAAGFAAGDEAAVRAVYARYAGPIVTVAMGTLGKRELADEVVQTTMLKAWRAAASFDPSRDLAPWLYAIARRVAIDIYRRETRAGTPEELSDDRAAVVPLSFERTWEAWEVRSALEQLKVPVGTVKSRSNRAYKRLASLLSHVVRATE
jgi:RNA polymerase sigma-70 factor, ECF subfamily